MKRYIIVMVFFTCTSLWAMEQKTTVTIPFPATTTPIVKIITQQLDPYRSQLVPDGGCFLLYTKQLLVLASRYINRTLGRQFLLTPQPEVPILILPISREAFEDTLAATSDHTRYQTLTAERQRAVLATLIRLRCTNIKEIVPDDVTPEPGLLSKFSGHVSPKEEEL